MGKQEFVDFYKNALDLSDDEVSALKQIILSPLPICFRSNYFVVDKYLEKYTNSLDKVAYLKNYYIIKDRSFYENQKFSKFIRQMSASGSLYRQELVSTLPVYFLDIQGNDNVLDLCAAPGSKSTMMVSYLRSGLLVANDVNSRRCVMLQGHLSELKYRNLLVTNNDATRYPLIRDSGNKVLFNKVLCDVPCSGDGTVRKHFSISTYWKETRAFGLCMQQFLIVKKGLELLAHNGLLVYSTCSMNPVENEFIIQKALNELNCEIVDCSEMDIHKFIKIRPGISHKKLDSFYKEHPLGFLDAPLSADIAKCMRIYPTDNNTGGFFVAVLRNKVAKIMKEVPELIFPDTRILRTNPDGTQFFSLESSILGSIEETYKTKIDDILITRSVSSNSLFTVTQQVVDLIKYSSKGLNVCGAGYKSFSLEKSGCRTLNHYRFTYNTFFGQNSVSLPIADFLILLRDEKIDISLLTGTYPLVHCSVYVKELDIILPAKFSARWGLLYINKRKRQSMKYLIENVLNEI